MRIIEIYLYHGFLGLPKDWNEVEWEISAALTGMNIFCRFHTDNLWIDFQEIISSSPHGGRSYFDVWCDFKRKKFEHLGQEKIFLGYSLGGRLLMHLPLTKEDNVLFAGYVSAHPGLVDQSQAKERRMMDALWHDNFQEERWEDLMKMWNEQAVFKNDARRPVREEYHFQRELLCRYFKDWSLGCQEPLDDFLRRKPVPQKWFYGANDYRYEALLPRMKQLFGTENCYSLLNSGHGILWDAPRRLAQLVVAEILKSEE